MSLDQLLTNLDELPEKVRTAVRNNAGGHYNHSLFWLMLRKNEGGATSGDAAKAIDDSFGSYSTFQQQFSDAATKVFGSGWGEETKTETTVIPMLSINNAVGQQSARNACSPLSLQSSIWVFVVMLLTVAASVFGQSPNTGASPASSSPASTPGALEPGTYSSCHVDGPYIAMTFDDGPSPGNTTRLLDILKQRNIKVTFFMIGPNVVAHPEIARRALAEGHEIGNHSWTHPQLSKLSNQRVTEEITKTQEAIKNACGFTPTLLRPPYGAITKRQREWIENQFGLNVILWSVDPLDWKRPGASVITQRILSGAQSGAIILSHDIHQQTVDAMAATLDALLAKGYKFVTVSELIAMNHPKPPSSPAAVSRTSDK